MNATVHITGTIMVALMIAAVGWSFIRNIKGKGFWRPNPLILELSILAGTLMIYLNQGSIGILLGIILLALSLAAMFVDKSKDRWLAIVQYISGAIPASGILFRAA
jgi:hypothetical protein